MRQVSQSSRPTSIETLDEIESLRRPKGKMQHAVCQRVSIEDLERRPMRDWRGVKLEKSLTMTEAMQLSRMELYRDPWVLTPQGHPFLQWWDLGTVVALVYVAMVTPVEVALLKPRIDFLFFVNRLVDMVFIVDMALQFCVAYHEKTAVGTRLVTRQKAIIRHYLKTWFAVDLLSILPFDAAGMMAEDSWIEKARLVKVLRLLRLIKLVRVLRASRVFRRWETSMSINYNTLKLATAFTVFLLASHWIACVWAMLATSGTEGEQTWADFAAPSAGETPSTPFDIYITSLYFSSMTVTSVGYGDVLPVTLFERAVCALLMFASGFLWAYALGEIMTALANSNVHEAGFRQMLDDLNHMMADRHLPRHLQRRLRAFFFQIKDLARVQGYETLVEQLSPALQGELAITVNEVWLRKVWYFGPDRSTEFTSNLATQLKVSVHAQGESLGEPWTLYILHRGLCVRRMRILHDGSVWGREFILSCRELLDAEMAFCLTFIEVSHLTRESFVDLLRRYPNEWPAMRRAVMWTALRRGIITEAVKRDKHLRARTSFMAFSRRFREEEWGSMQHFPLSTREDNVAEEAGGTSVKDCEVAEQLETMSTKQEEMEAQLGATRTLLADQLARIEKQLQLLLPPRRERLA